MFPHQLYRFPQETLLTRNIITTWLLREENNESKILAEFREILSDRSRFEDKHECKYVKQLKEPSGTVVFSVRGSKDVHIFLCQFEDTEKGPCFWVILGKWNGKRSEILNCPHGILEDGLCFDVAKVTVLFKLIRKISTWVVNLKDHFPPEEFWISISTLW